MLSSLLILTACSSDEAPAKAKAKAKGGQATSSPYAMMSGADYIALQKRLANTVRAGHLVDDLPDIMVHGCLNDGNIEGARQALTQGAQAGERVSSELRQLASEYPDTRLESASVQAATALEALTASYTGAVGLVSESMVEPSARSALNSQLSEGQTPWRTFIGSAGSHRRGELEDYLTPEFSKESIKEDWYGLSKDQKTGDALSVNSELSSYTSGQATKAMTILGLLNRGDIDYRYEEYLASEHDPELWNGECHPEDLDLIGVLDDSLVGIFENSLSVKDKEMRKYLEELTSGWALKISDKSTYEAAVSTIDEKTAACSNCNTVSELLEQKTAIQSEMESLPVGVEDLKVYTLDYSSHRNVPVGIDSVTASASTYYNCRYKNDTKWRSFKLKTSSKKFDERVTGYCAKGEPQCEELFQTLSKRDDLTLRNVILRYPSSNSVCKESQTELISWR